MSNPTITRAELELSDVLDYYRNRNGGKRKKFVPVPESLIYALDGKAAEKEGRCFAFLPLADLAELRNRIQGGMEFAIGQKFSRFAAAKRASAEKDRRVEEIAHANDISQGKRVFRKESAKRRAMEKQHAKVDAGQDWNPYEVASAYEAYTEAKKLADYMRNRLETATPEILELAQQFEEIAELERRAKRWINLGERQVSCGMWGVINKCSNCTNLGYTPFHCKNRYCSNCGKANHSRLYKKYLRLEEALKRVIAENPGLGLKCITLTTLKDSERGMPDREAPRKMKRDVYKLSKVIKEKIADMYGREFSAHSGLIYGMEFGDKKIGTPYGNNNLHLHGILVGPYIPQKWLEEQWSKIRGEKTRVHIREPQPDIKNGRTAYGAALWWALEYTGKYASASSPERAVELEQAFEGCRRVEALGLFRTLKPEEEEQGAALRQCPSCTIGILTSDREVGWIPVAELERLGYRNLQDVAREVASSAERIAAARAVYAPSAGG